MNKIQRLSFLGVVAGVLCGSGAWAAAAASKPDAAGGPFEQLVDDFVFGTLALSPTSATSFGYHVHHGAALDDMLDDFSPAGLAASRELLHEMDARIAKLDVA